MLEEIKELYQYNAWASQRVFEAVARLSPEEFNRDLKSSFPSVRETLLHLISAEWIWLSRWKGTSPSKAPNDWDSSSFSSLRSIWNGINNDLLRFVDGLTDSNLAAEITYRNIKGDSFSNSMSQMLRHLVNHSTYHRGQVATMIRQLGKEAVSTDLIIFFREKDAGK